MRSSIAIAMFALAGASASVSAAPVVYNLALPNIGTFDSTVTGTGAALSAIQVVAGQSTYGYTDTNGNAGTLTITRPNGSAVSPGGSYSSGPFSLSGAAFNINPSIGSGDVIPGFNSGLRFSFSTPVNALGFEIGDWATCCLDGTRPAAIQSAYAVPATGSGLWIAFDGGAATLPANALTALDNPGVSLNSFTNFIGAIDASSTFQTVNFFGDGFGEFLVAGGTLRFAAVPIGSVGNVPEPGTLALLGVIALGSLRARRKQS